MVSFCWETRNYRPLSMVDVGLDSKPCQVVSLDSSNAPAMISATACRFMLPRGNVIGLLRLGNGGFEKVDEEGQRILVHRILKLRRSSAKSYRSRLQKCRFDFHIYIYIHAHIVSYVYIYIYRYTHVYIHICIYLYIKTYLYLKI